jgi:hypothetical protein
MENKFVLTTKLFSIDRYNKGRIFLVMKKHVTYNDNVPVFLSAIDGILDRYSQSVSVKSGFKPGTSRFLRRNKYKSYSGMGLQSLYVSSR